MAFFRNCWYMAFWSQDLPHQKLLARRLLGEPLVFFRSASGAISALVDACPHRYAPLSMGRLSADGTEVQCGYHGLVFNGTGLCVRNPHASGRIPANSNVRSYTIVERHGIAWIWMGSQKPDPAVVPDFSIFDNADPKDVSHRDYMRMDANYMLINENLLDLSHASVLHEGVLGNDDMIPAKIEVRQENRRLWVTRFMPNVPAPSLYDQLFERNGGPVDIWAEQRWDCPGCFINNTGATRPGSSRDEGTGVLGTHFLTPETETTTHYYFCAIRQNPRTWGEPVDSEIRSTISSLRRQAFEFEDKAIIDAQQLNLNDPAINKAKPVVLEVDAGPARCRRIMAELIDAEQASGDGG